MARNTGLPMSGSPYEFGKLLLHERELTQTSKHACLGSDKVRSAYCFKLYPDRSHSLALAVVNWDLANGSKCRLKVGKKEAQARGMVVSSQSMSASQEAGSDAASHLAACLAQIRCHICQKFCSSMNNER